MTKQVQARAITVALLVAVAGFVFWKQAGGRLPDAFGAAVSATASSRQDDQPRNAIYRMLDAAREGDVAAYIDCHTGEMSQKLAQSRDEMTAQGFADYLEKRNREIKGIAILEPQLASEDQARIDVEYVYADRKEGQRFYLVRMDGVWKIRGVEVAERVETPVPYGTPVY